ncbi:NAD-dependent epimerase/dehydratase family protein [Polynucleobacter sp. AP-Elch-400A-B2]|uniref:NAD-dependent epimerase/dehydratase family protein n=1 Tax=Polynucleobacter sp. AP-Elch-400A-B2 TaxID=2576930 RepID=UPI001BFE5F61|nr:NAD-dependent epimerase/dehydratase family protein [Polynucleobacter sp. AP-Elch-400A-B2]QWE24988.1 NAD-dependent epimerase/dehydratase family protein [Polynucleobacter sp. AP-Elch-400A-B2]
MSIAIVTGSAGLIGSETAKFFTSKGFDVVGIDNDMRAKFFGNEASTAWNRELLEKNLHGYKHYDCDIRDHEALKNIFSRYGKNIEAIIHTAAQPSHDWAARDPEMDFTVNANGTLNMLESTRRFCPDAVFMFTSTNKVYGDTPNYLPLIEKETRWELENHEYALHGVDESMSIDQSKHSLFGASKVAADILVQEYGRYFDMKTGVFRGGCLTGPAHSGTKLHGFLSYLGKCVFTGENYSILGYKGKQVRDNIHSFDLVNMFWHFFSNPRSGEVYNAGGGRFSNCSMLEAISMFEESLSRPLNYQYVEGNRSGDHVWWISDTRKFQNHYPGWSYNYSIERIIKEIAEAVSEGR